MSFFAALQEAEAELNRRQMIEKELQVHITELSETNIALQAQLTCSVKSAAIHKSAVKDGDRNLDWCRRNPEPVDQPAEALHALTGAKSAVQSIRGHLRPLLVSHYSVEGIQVQLQNHAASTKAAVTTLLAEVEAARGCFAMSNEELQAATVDHGASAASLAAAKQHKLQLEEAARALTGRVGTSVANRDSLQHRTTHADGEGRAAQEAQAASLRKLETARARQSAAGRTATGSTN